jgi:predicted ribosome quality control (RQC) complex YloA/Tae2 family protein
MSASDYAERLYRRARKLRQSIPHLTKRVAETERALLRVEQDDRDRSVQSPECTALRQGAAVSTRQSEKRRSPDPRHQIHPRRYRTRDGAWLVLVGRDDRENDVLSLKVAGPEDYWFHAHGGPGSHVVLRREGRNDTPSRQAIAEAAGLAAHWSKQRGASKAGVSYTLAKHVTKPRGAKPGTVAIRHEKLLVVPPALLPRADEPLTGEHGEE